ncbi:hypothetical protein [Haloglycomyces albus]|uniref:hypothetical protein n=1 Tax=Haloglycomyces albus TaxID=526067 RepID=UPI00046D2D3D|nr:hypothetical protein [Haloglycomyces albus]
MKRFTAVLFSTLLFATGCGDSSEPDDDSLEGDLTEDESPSESSEPVELDPEAAGGLCPLIDADRLMEITGDDFKYASGYPNEDTDADEEEYDESTCVFKTAEGSFPDVTLANGSGAVSVETYTDREIPDDAEPIDDLGDIGYVLTVSEETGAGPAVYLGWLSEADDVWFELRYTAADDADTEDIYDHSDDFVELARDIESRFTEQED